MKCIPMRCTPMRCTPMRCTPGRYTPLRHTPMRYTLEMHARKVLGETSRSPTLQTVMRWLIYRDLSCKIRVFILRSLSTAAEYSEYIPNG
jgi:hypothetical protein